MPHDCKGRLIEVGAVIRVKPCNEKRLQVGHVIEVIGGETCSGQMIYPSLGRMKTDYFDAKDAELLLTKEGHSPPE